MRTLLTLLFVLLAGEAGAQFYWQENFEYPGDDYRNLFIIDTVSHAHNLWQIGAPHKDTFNAAYSVPNCIITDTVNTYPVSDTSVFYVRTILPMIHPLMLNLAFKYKLDIDSLSTARVEVSGDVGLNWINTMTEDTTYLFYWGGAKPRLDTSVHVWKSFNLNIEHWAYAYPGGPDTFPHYLTSDTLLFRFTFISGSDSVHKEGWMMDNFMQQNGQFVGGLSHGTQANDGFEVYPNPSNGNVYLSKRGVYGADEVLAVYDMNGRKVYSTPVFGNGYMYLPLDDGLYMVRLGDGAFKRVVVCR